MLTWEVYDDIRRSQSFTAFQEPVAVFSFGVTKLLVTNNAVISIAMCFVMRLSSERLGEFKIAVHFFDPNNDDLTITTKHGNSFGVVGHDKNWSMSYEML